MNGLLQGFGLVGGLLEGVELLELSLESVDPGRGDVIPQDRELEMNQSLVLVPWCGDAVLDSRVAQTRHVPSPVGTQLAPLEGLG